MDPQAKPVDGKGGDEGIDTFIGEFNGKLQAFQHKYFLGPLGKSQRQQILKSIGTADAHHKVEAWTLMLPHDLNPAEIKWFSSVTKKHPHIQMDWWGKTKLQGLLANHPIVARDFQPTPSVVVYVLRSDLELRTASTEALVATMSASAGITDSASAVAETQRILIAAAEELKRRVVLRVLIFGPAPSNSDIYAKRLQIRNLLEKLGHVVHYGEDVCTPDILFKTGLNLSVAELIQARKYDYIVVLMTSPGTIGEVHDFAGKREFATRMMICVDAQHQLGYSGQGILRIFEGLNGKIDWFRYPIDVTDCHLASRILDQVAKVAESKHWELAVGTVPL